MDEECWCAQVGEMLCPLLPGAARGMERIGEQKQASDKLRFFGTEHAGLTSAVGVAAEIDAR